MLSSLRLINRDCHIIILSVEGYGVYRQERDVDKWCVMLCDDEHEAIWAFVLELKKLVKRGYISYPKK